jgi:hypothetical protein
MAELLRRTVGNLLEREPGVALCDACLALACSASLMELRAITESLIDDGRFQRGSMCASCGRTVPTTWYEPAARTRAGTIA